MDVMANYSAQRIKSVALNNDKRRYAKQDSEDAPEPIQAVPTVPTTPRNMSNKRPLINPLSEGGAPKVSKPQPEMDIQSLAVASFNWLQMFHRTFLSVYLIADDALVGAGKFDFAFQIGNQRLYVLTHEEVERVESTSVSKSFMAQLTQQAATYINKRYQQISSRFELPVSGDDGLANVHYVGLTAITLNHEGRDYQIEHEFGSTFFQEDCVLDLDDESRVMQLFSLNGFYQMIKLLQTPSDLLSFFDYHLEQLVNFHDFSGEYALAQHFLASPAFFKRAVAVQQQLVEIGLLSKVETRLSDMVAQPDNAQIPAELEKKHAELSQKLQSYSSIFQKLLNGTTKRRHDAQDTLPLPQVKLLVAESMYTRMSIIEEMMAYETRSQQECLNGYLCHQHSYNDFGHHYVIVVYGLDANAEYSRQYIEQNHQNLLMDINAQLQDPAMKEYFILGFDMSNHDGKGNVTVQMDVFHQSGSVMSDIEKRYYQQAHA